MQSSSESDKLNELINLLKVKQAIELNQLKEQFTATKAELRPSKLIKNTISELITPPSFNNGLVNTAIGIGTGFLTKKLLVGSSLNPIRLLAGLLIQFVVTNVVSKNAGPIKSASETIYNELVPQNGNQEYEK